MKHGEQKTLIILISVFHGNTAKVADVLAEVLNADVKSPREVKPEDLQQYDLIGFGSGIYDQKHHASLLTLADSFSNGKGKKVFLFSTSGISRAITMRNKIDDPHNALRDKLQAKGYKVVSEFNCPGFNDNSFLKLFGGMNKGRPNKNDLEQAEVFARKLATANTD